MSMQALAVTESVCPVCLSRIAAERVAEGDDVFLVKHCPEHGEFRTVVWRGLAALTGIGMAAALVTGLTTPQEAEAVREATPIFEREGFRIEEFGKEILVGLSRKSFLFRPLGVTPSDVLPATQVADFVALQNGADILRVHDVAEAVRTVKLYRLLYGVKYHRIAAPDMPRCLSRREG